MSQYPQYPQQQPASPYTPPVPNYYAGSTAPKRPTSITAVAIIGIVIGALSLLCVGPSVVLNSMMLVNGGKNPLVPALPPMNQSVIAFSVFQTSLNLLLALVMLVGCVGALYLKPWARKVMMPWAAITLVWAVIVTVVTIVWINPESQRAVRSMQAQISPGTVSAQGGVTEIVGAIGAIFTGLVFAAVPVCVLTLWTRVNVRAAFGDPAAIQELSAQPSMHDPYNPQPYAPGTLPPPQ